MNFIRCKVCLMPSTRPDVPHTDGVCQACTNYQNRPAIDWDSRKAALLALLDRFDGRVIVPSSGGKDSTYQVITLMELGADVTVVTARTCHLTELGRANIDNLARYARTIEYVPNMTVRAKLNRLGLQMVGDISWPEHAAIFSTPFRAAVDLGIPLIMYGECPQAEYGGPMGSEQAMQMTARWRSEFGGFLGLRPADFVGMEGITARDMKDYELPGEMAMIVGRLSPTKGAQSVEAHFLGQYIPWDSRRNAAVAIDHGMQYELPCATNYWAWENLDNAQTGIHDHMALVKYGYGRGTAQISVDIRSGRMDRETGLKIAQVCEAAFPTVYAGVWHSEILERIGLTDEDYSEIVAKWMP